MTQTSQQTQDSAAERTLHVALALSKTSWKLAFSDGGVGRPRVVAVAGRGARVRPLTCFTLDRLRTDMP